MRKVLILTGDGGEALEVMYPYQRLLEAGFSVDIAAPSKKMIQTVVHDFEPGFDTYTEKRGYRVQATLAFHGVRPADYVGLVIPGGRAPEYIRNDEHCRRIVQHFFQIKKPVAAICHAALILIPLKVLKGKKVAAYPALRPDMEEAGATFMDQEVVVDGQLVTSRAWPDHPAFMREFLKLISE